MTRVCHSVLTFLACLAFCAPSWADVVELKSGERAEGKFRQATAAGVVIEVGGHELVFPLEKVRAIYFGSVATLPGEPPDAREALKALKALQSLAGEGITYQDYVARVNEARTQVDRYLTEPERSDAQVRAAIKEAMGFYALASTAWSAKITNRFDDVLAVGRDPMLDRCPVLQRALARYPLGTTREQDFARGIVATLEISLIWSCGSDRTDEAEALLEVKR